MAHDNSSVGAEIGSGVLDFSTPDPFNPVNHTDFTLFDTPTDGSFDLAASFGANATQKSTSAARLATDTIDSPHSSDPLTVSPKDIFMDHASAPPSAALTNLSTPQTTFDSPGIAHSTDTSPMFLGDDLDDDPDLWDPLFPTEESIDTTHMAQSGAPDMTAPPMHRAQSSPGGTGSRHSSVAGVKARKRDKPLKFLDIDNEDDPIARKRMKNTEAARKSRAKKQERVDAMQERIDELEREVALWKARALANETV